MQTFFRLIDHLTARIRQVPSNSTPWIAAQSVLLIGITAVFLTALGLSVPSAVQEEVPEMVARQSETVVEHQQIASMVNIAFSALEVTPVLMTPEPTHPTQTPTVTPTVFLTRTLLPDDYLNNGSQTDGVAVAGTVLIIIVIFGVLVFMPRK